MFASAPVSLVPFVPPLNAVIAASLVVLMVEIADVRALLISATPRELAIAFSDAPTRAKSSADNVPLFISADAAVLYCSI